MMSKNKVNLKKIFNFIKLNIFIVVALSIIAPKIYAKPVPPGSGEGDVPANILFLLDSSLSMNKAVTGGTYLGLAGVDWAVEISDGNIIAGERGRGVVKILTADNKMDTSFAGNKKNFMGKWGDSNCTTAGKGDNKQNSRVIHTVSGDIASDGTIWFGSGTDGGKVVAIDSNGNCVGALSFNTTKIAYPKALEIRNIGGDDILFVWGRTFKNKSKGQLGHFYVQNIGNGSSFTGVSMKCDVTKDQIFHTTKKDMSKSMTISKNGTYTHFARKNGIFTFTNTDMGNNLRCPKKDHTTILNADSGGYMTHKTNGKSNSVTGVNSITSIRASSDDDNIIFVTSKNSATLQKIELDVPNANYDVLVTAGKSGTKTTGDPGTVAAADIKFNSPGVTSASKIDQNLWVSSSSILATSKNGGIQQIDENKFNSTDMDTAWQAQYGGGQTTRFDGAKDAILEIVSDSSLQAGANFGFGHWNGGEYDVKKKNKNKFPSERWCHKNDGCHYYQGGWKGEHPAGTSAQCNHHSCINVGISRTGKDDIPGILGPLYMKYATDANAFADLAYGYFKDELKQTNIIDKRKPCQLNYVIVIGDGRMFNETRSIPQIKDLRTKYNVRTLIVAYGGAYNDATAKPIFDRFAKAGSCDVTGAADCVETIQADTPGDLKTELEAKIRQIIADRLSFTAPSITATIQEGGAIYQAQFNFEQHGEWVGRLLRKAINPETQKVEASMNYSDANGKNWDAGEAMPASADRKIWTALNVNEMPQSTYIGNWNNWKISNYQEINDLFESTGNLVVDYHNESSTCKDADGVADGTTDDIKGLIKFVRGTDYFDYNGGCDIEEDRPSLLSDIYHSQLVEVGTPGANTAFNSNNQESYWRASQGYSQFKRAQKDRSSIIYAGSNGGMLHAFNADDGSEEWAFIPPMIAAKLPLMINTGYDGKFKKNLKAGGSNAIFGVDGSPVLHDVKIKGLSPDGSDYENSKSWRTLLFIPYGRGGAGFSVLDVTNPKITTAAVDDDGNSLVSDEGVVQLGGQGPLHMFSIYNDTYNKSVVRIDHNGVVTRFSYLRGAINLAESEEGKRARDNQSAANLADGDSYTDFTNRDAIQDCESDDDFSPDFRTSGDTACYKGTTFTFKIDLPSGSYSTSGEVKEGALRVLERLSDDWYQLDSSEVKAKKDSDGNVIVTFTDKKVFNTGTGLDVSDVIKIETSCDGSGVDNPKFDYSQLGETWSTPRILRVPQYNKDTGATKGNITTDRYVAVMGAGYGATSQCSGSGVYIIDLEGGADTEDAALVHEAGKLYGTELLGGALKILDSDPKGLKMGIAGTYSQGSPIKNSTTATPIVITADAVPNVPWRGGLVYINDMEGKITKINLTSRGKLFEQQTLMNLKANFENKRLSYFEMDAAIGTSTGNFWLFGGTGDFNRISEIDDATSFMDNIAYGIRDYDFPYFKSSITYPVALSGSANFVSSAATALEQGPNIDDLTDCTNTTDDNYPTCNVAPGKLGWKYSFGIADGLPSGETQNTFKKASGAPTIYRGKVYYPIYQPDKENNCNLGTAFVCAYDDECGSLDTTHIDDSVVEGSCYNVGAGILSKLVVFGGRLFANLAGPSEDALTLVEILATDKQFRSYRKSWRENF